MITDRTQADIDAAKTIFSEKFSQGIALTDEEKNTMERAFATVTCINRIESKEAELSSKMLALLYTKQGITTKTWATEIFTYDEFKRLVDNCIFLKNTYFTKTQMENPKTVYSFNEFNILEKTLQEIAEILAENDNYAKRSGIAICGSTKLHVKGA